MPCSSLAPELLILIGDHLSRKSLAICSRVCKDWKHAFSQLVWNKVVYDIYKAPGRIDLQSHRHFVKDIHINNNSFTGELLDLTFPNLNTLYFHSCATAYPINFILSQQSLKCLYLSSMEVRTTLPATFWQTLSGFKSLETLAICYHILDYTSETEATMFWNACAQIKHLYLINTRLFYGGSSISKPALDTLLPITFPRLHTLEIIDSKTPNNGLLGSFFQRCPNLKKFQLGISPRDERLLRPELMHVAKNFPLAFRTLEVLDLEFCNFKDTDLAIVLSTLVNIKTLNIRSGFGLRSLDAFRPHFGTIQRLEIATSPKDISSAILQEIMSSCPLLEHLKGHRMLATDILQSPWICTKLRHLEIRLELGINGTNDMNILVLDQLSRLTKLERLQLGRYYIETGSVQLTLEGGLGKLSTLKNLRLVRVSSNSMDLGDAEVDWMVAHWNKLEIFRGTLHSDQLTDQAYKMRLKNELSQFRLEDFYM